MTTDNPQYIYVVKDDGISCKAKLYRAPIRKITAKQVFVERRLAFRCVAMLPRQSCHLTPEAAIVEYSQNLRKRITFAQESIRRLDKILGSIDHIDPKVAHDED